MTRKFFVCALMALCFSAARSKTTTDSISIPATADQRHIEDLKNSQKLMIVNGDSTSLANDSVRKLIARFYVDQYHHFQDPEAPYFLMMSKDATLALGLGGAVRMRGYYNFDGSVPYAGFIPYTIPVPADPSMRRKLNATPSGTALFLRIIGTNKKVGNFSAYIQGSFDGGTGSEFKLKKSYVTINDVTIGYATSAFVDITANPPVIDAQGPSGQTNNTSVLVTWRHPTAKGWVWSGSVEFPSSSIQTNNYTASIDDWFPDIVGYAERQWANGAGHVRLSGLLRVLPYRDLVTETNHNKIGFGGQLTGVIPVGYSTTLYAEAVGGKGCESYINDFSVSGFDLIPSTTDGKLYAPWCYGLTAGVKYNIMPDLFASLSVSESRLMARSGVAPTEYKYGLYGVANIFWNMSPRLQVGAEYLMGQRKNFNGETGSAKRVNLLFQFSF